MLARKGEYHEDAERPTRTPYQLRPIALMQGAAKLLAAAANHSRSQRYVGNSGDLVPEGRFSNMLLSCKRVV